MLYTKDTLDVNGMRLLWGDYVSTAVFYDSSTESWDRADGSSSWFTERLLPHDEFYGPMHSDRWVVEGASAGRTCTVSGGAQFSISSSEGSIYLSSEGLWELSGDFRISVGVNTGTYYDEYRSATSFGINACFGGEYSVRCAIATGYGDASASYQMLYADGGDPRFFGWSSVAPPVLYGVSADTLTISREGSTITAFAGPHTLGTVSGTEWSGECFIKIGAESAEINTFAVMADYFTVESGTLSAGPGMFDSDVRGPSSDFPSTALLLADASGVSVVNYEDVSLWARLRIGENKALSESPRKISAADGQIYFAMSDGVVVLDFVHDVVRKYSGALRYESLGNIASRNAHLYFGDPSSTHGLLSDSVNDIHARTISGETFVGIATEAGLNVLTSSGTLLSCSSVSAPTTAVHIAADGGLFFGSTDSDGQGQLSYLSNVLTLTTITGTSFSRTGYFDKNTDGFTLSSSSFTHIASGSDGLSTHVAVSHPSGIDVLLYPPSQSPRVEVFSVPVPGNPIADPGFSKQLGVSWKYVRSRVQPVATTSIDGSWSTVGTSSLRLYPGNPNITDYYTVPGDYTGVYQRVDLTGVSRIYFDLHMVAPVSSLYTGQCRYEVWVGSSVAASYNEPATGVVTRLSESIDVSAYTGSHDILILVVVVGSSLLVLDRFAYFDNFRTQDYSAQFSVLGGTDPAVLGTDLIFQDAVGKISYYKSDGYGAFDLWDRTSDFFLPATSALNLQAMAGGLRARYGSS